VALTAPDKRALLTGETQLADDERIHGDMLIVRNGAREVLGLRGVLVIAGCQDKSFCNRGEYCTIEGAAAPKGIAPAKPAICIGGTDGDAPLVYAVFSLADNEGPRGDTDCKRNCDKSGMRSCASLASRPRGGTIGMGTRPPPL
jgi:hypothetical protein